MNMHSVPLYHSHVDNNFRDTRGPLHKTFTGEKTQSGYFNQSFFSYGKVNGKIMLTGIFRFYQFFSGKSFMQ